MNMSQPGNSDEAHPSHCIPDHGAEWANANKDTIHISARAMSITWGHDDRFWRWIKLPKNESRFETAVELVQVNWLEVTGTLDLAKSPLSPSTTYEVLYVVKFKVDAMGWHSLPVTFQLITPDGHTHKKAEILELKGTKVDEWHHVHGGEFTLTDTDVHGKLKFGMFEVQSNWWKGGMIFEGVIIRPKLV